MSPANGGEEEEDDYMSMVIEEPQQKETFAQKKLRKQREKLAPKSPRKPNLLLEKPPVEMKPCPRAHWTRPTRGSR